MSAPDRTALARRDDARADDPRDLGDAGFVSVVEVVYIGIAALVAIVFLGFVGRLAASGIQVTNAAQDSARAASIEIDPVAADQAARSAVSRSGLPARCEGSPSTTMTWTPSAQGTWQGGVVTVIVTCTVANQTLTGGVWSPGVRTISVSDSQVVERYRR
ncbi:hypothetical protein [Ilumatobacter sp.]|uniref:hypothetical protein n=1 Tax=Ilumatobacter sp. TaxID=1967498 RepID=UPI003B5244D2